MGYPARYVEYQGEQWRVSELAKHLGIKPSTLDGRIRRGHPLDVMQRVKTKPPEGPLNGLRMQDHPLYSTYKSMRNRCYNPDAHNYKNYGGRGVRMCEAWEKSFWQFVADMPPRPSPGHSIDRYPDSDGNYEPGNVRWATKAEQRATQRQPTLKESPRPEVWFVQDLPDTCRPHTACIVAQTPLGSHSVGSFVKRNEAELICRLFNRPKAHPGQDGVSSGQASGQVSGHGQNGGGQGG